MHILIVHSGFFSALEDSMHGLFQRQQANVLYKSGFRVGVLSAGFLPLLPSRLLRYELSSKGQLLYPIMRKYRSSFLLGRWMLKLFRNRIVSDYIGLYEDYVTKYGKPDVIHAHNCFCAGIVSSKIKEKYSIPFVLTENSSSFQRNLYTHKEKQLAKSVYTRADQLCFVSKFQAQKIVSIIAFENASYSVVYNLVDQNLGVLHQNRNNSSKNEFTFLSIGTLDENKNHALLIESFVKAFGNTPNVNLKIIGNGVLFNSLTNLIIKFKASSRIKLLGEYGRSQLADELAASNCIVSSSNVETFGVALIEGLLLGKPIISTASGGPNEIVNERNGLLVPTHDVDSLSSAMFRLFTTAASYDSKIIQEDCINRFGEKIFVDRITRIYHSVVEASN